MRAKLMCRILGHDLVTMTYRTRVCARCGLRETLRDFGHVTGWQEAAQPVPVARPDSARRTAR